MSVDQNYRLTDLMRIYRRGSSSIYADIAAGKLPKQIKCGKTSIWLKSEIDADIERRIAERDEAIVGNG